MDGTTQHRYPLVGLSEDSVWTELAARAPQLEGISENVFRITGYVVTELINNAIDHSSGQWVELALTRRDPILVLRIEDDGIGIFQNLRDKLALPDLLAAIQQVSKGKVTTDPARHTGEGIFFTSRISDLFVIESNGLSWKIDSVRGDVAVGETDERRGTSVECEINVGKTTSLEQLFAEYTEDYEFARTRIVVKLFELGVHFISRSEAKRLLVGLDRFKEVLLDFKNVKDVGQGFADEIFRVWAAEHLGITLVPMNMNSAVEFMINRARQHS